MDIIRKKRAEQEERAPDITADFDDHCMEPLKEAIERILNEEANGVRLPNGVHAEEEDSRERVERVRSFLRDREFEAVARLIIHLDEGNYEERKRMPHEAQVIYFVVLLRSYLMDNYVSGLQLSGDRPESIGSTRRTRTKAITFY